MAEPIIEAADGASGSTAAERGSALEVLRIFLRLGLTSFGGPIAHLGYYRAEFVERTKGKPTPTQEENDLAAYGVHIVEHDPDGSDPDPHGQAGGAKAMEAQRSGRGAPQGYPTRQHTKAE